MNRSPLTLLGAVLVYTLSLAPVWCSDPDASRGRLPDGRAFRVDDQGNQLVDYIAELEVNVEQLNRQVQSLQDELNEKRAGLARAEQDKATQTALLEKDLLNSKQEIAEKSRADCGPEISRLNDQITTLKSDLEEAQSLSDRQGRDHDQVLAQLKQNLEDKEIDLAQAKKELAESRQEADDLRLVTDDLKRRHDERESQQVARAAPQWPAGGQQTQAVSAEMQGGGQAQASGTPASLSLARARAVDALRGKMLTDINQVQSLIVTRDELYRKYTQKRRSVAFTPSAPISSSRRGVKEISTALKSASSVYELSAVGHEISEIQSKVSEDIGLMKRMDKVNG